MSYFAVDRRIFDHPLFRSRPEWLRAWQWLIASAAWCARTDRLAFGTVELERGQIGTTVRDLAEKWGWSKSNVDYFLRRLEAEAMITRARIRTKSRTNFGTKNSHPATLITICNYNKFQSQPKLSPDESISILGPIVGQLPAQVVDLQGNPVPNHSNHSNQQQKLEGNLFGKEGRGTHVHRRPPREGAVSRDRKTHFFSKNGPNWEAHAADYREAHGAEPKPDRNGGFWFWIAGEEFRDWKREPPRRVRHGPGLPAPGMRRASRSATG